MVQSDVVKESTKSCENLNIEDSFSEGIVEETTAQIDTTEKNDGQLSCSYQRLLQIIRFISLK